MSRCTDGTPEMDVSSMYSTDLSIYNRQHNTSPDEHSQHPRLQHYTTTSYLEQHNLGFKLMQSHSHVTRKTQWGSAQEYIYSHISSCKCSDMPHMKCVPFYIKRWLLNSICSPIFKSSVLPTTPDPTGNLHDTPSPHTSSTRHINLNNDTTSYSQDINFSNPVSVSTKNADSTDASIVTFLPQSALKIASLLLLLLLVHIPSSSNGEPVKVHVHAIIPSHFAMTTDLTREFHNTLLNFRRDHKNQRFRSLFNPDGDITFITDDTPREILDAFCKGVLAKHATSILNVNNPLGIRRRTSSNQYILELANYLGIPVISWDSQYSDTSKAQRTLQLAPTIEHQAMAMVSLLERYNWTAFTIVTSRVAGDSQFVAAVNKLVDLSKRRVLESRSGVRRDSLEILSTVHIRHPSEAGAMLEKVVGSDVRVFLLHCSSRASYDIIEAAVTLGLTGRDYVWILTRSSMPSGKFGLASFPVGMLGISFEYGLEAMKRVVRTGIRIWLFGLLDMFNRPGELANKTLVPPFSCRSASDSYWKDGDVMYRHMLSVKFREEPYIEFTENGTLQKTEVTIVNLQWQDGQKNKTEWREVGKWTRHGLMMDDITWPGESPVPPTGKPKRAFLRVATLNELPYVIYRMPQEEGICEENALPCQTYPRDKNKDILSNVTVLRCCVGLSMDLLKILSTQLNFDFTLTEVQDGKWGSINKATKEWNGLVKVLLENKADVVVTAMKINPERAEAVRFSVPYLETGIKIIVALRGGAISPTAFLEPYDYASWSLILVFSVHATGSSILIFEWLSPYGLNRGRTPMREHRFSLFRSFWLIWSMLFSTSVPTNTPKGIASRFLANIWALFALVFLASYTANLAAFMITKEEYYDLSGIQDYRLQNPYTMNPPFKYATVPNGSTESNIRANHKDMFNYMKPYNQPDVDSGIEALKGGKIQAFIYDSSVLEYYTSRDPQCRLVTVGNRYAMTGYGVGFQPDFKNPWIDKFNRVILKLQQAGELDRLQKFWLTGACKSKKETSLANRTLGILNFTSAFILLGTGVLLGLVILCLEHLYFIFWRKHLRELDKCGCCSLVSLSMGKSLQTCGDRVLHGVNRDRCKDPLCEAHIWKLKHQLDMALLKIHGLENKISYPEPDYTKTPSTAVATNTDVYHEKYIVALSPNYSRYPHTTTTASTTKGYVSNYNITELALDSPTLTTQESTAEYLSRFPESERVSLSRENQTLSSLHVLHRQSNVRESHPASSFPELCPASSFQEPHRISFPKKLQFSDKINAEDSKNEGNRFEEGEDTSTLSNTVSEPSFPPPPPLEDEPHLLHENSRGTRYDHAAIEDHQYNTNAYLLLDGHSCAGSSGNIVEDHGGVFSESPAQKLRRTPSYTSAIGSSLNSDLTLDAPTCAATLRQFEGKQYSGVDNSNHLI